MSRTQSLAQLLGDQTLVPDVQVSGLTLDSRQLQPGDAFVAISGFGAHGLGFVEQARANGAAAILFEPPAPADLPAPSDAIAVPGLRARMGALADAFHGQPSRAMQMVGVTGTNGKTSTVQLLVQAWTLLGTRAGSIGTLGAGLHGQLQANGFTTPLVLQTHQLLAQMRDAGAAAVAMEVSSHALDQGRVDAVHFDVAVFTNLTRDHLDYHHDMDSYGAAKARLFVRSGLQAAVINLDDAYAATLQAQLAPSLRCVGVSSRGAEAAQVRAAQLHLDNEGIAFELQIEGQSWPVRSALLGRFNVDNLLAVAATLHALQVAPARIAEVLGQLQPISGRMNRLGGDGVQPLVVVDFAHTPDALQQALDNLRGHLHGRLLCVFGCGGERDAGKRPQMAAIAAARAEQVLVTDDNPRNEDGDAIVADIVAGFAAHDGYTVCRDRAQAIASAIAQAGPDDIVLIAGKGHEPYQEVRGVRHPFADAEVAAAALAALPGTLLQEAQA